MVEPESTERNLLALVEIVQDCLTALWDRPTQRRVMGLVMAGYSNGEIADTLGMPPATVRSNLRHTRNTLTSLYDDTLDDVRLIQLLHDSCAAYRSGERPPIPLRPVISKSWDRAKAIGMPASNGTKVEQIGEDELAYRRARSRLTTDCGWVLRKLNKLAADTDSMSVLADADGVVLARGGDRGIMGEADKIGFVTQAWWNFDHVGPGGIALAIETRRMVVVRMFEHFMIEQEKLSCVAVPVVDPSDDRMWILNLTGTRPGFHHAILLELETIARQLARHLATDY